MEDATMEIGNFLQVGDIRQTEFSAQRREQEDAAVRGDADGDTVSISAEAFALAKQMYGTAFGLSLAQDDGEESGNAASSSEAVNDYKRIFDDYRGLGLFSEDETAGTGASASDDAGSGSTGREAAKLEKQIKDLLEKLETVMSSDMPEVQKDMQGNEIQKKIAELQSTLASMKRAQQAGPSAAGQA